MRQHSVQVMCICSLSQTLGQQTEVHGTCNCISHIVKGIETGWGVRGYCPPPPLLHNIAHFHFDSRFDVPGNCKNIAYFLACLSNRNMKYIGKGTHLGYRIINNHMSESISGISTCNFLRHVCNCRKVNKNLKEPSRSLCCDKFNVSNLLIDYESRKFRQGYAFMSRPDTLNSLSRRQHTTTLITMSVTLILLALYN